MGGGWLGGGVGGRGRASVWKDKKASEMNALEDRKEEGK